MNPKTRYSDVLALPTRSLDGEVWVQCQLRLTFQYQSRHGISLHLCDPSRRCLRIGLGEILDHRSGRAIYDAMLKQEIDDDFQDEFQGHLDEADHLDREAAGRLAFNLTMDGRWEEIERSATSYCESEASMNENWSGA